MRAPMIHAENLNIETHISTSGRTMVINGFVEMHHS